MFFIADFSTFSRKPPLNRRKPPLKKEAFKSLETVFNMFEITSESKSLCEKCPSQNIQKGNGLTRTMLICMVFGRKFQINCRDIFVYL